MTKRWNSIFFKGHPQNPPWRFFFIKKHRFWRRQSVAVRFPSSDNSIYPLFYREKHIGDRDASCGIPVVPTLFTQRTGVILAVFQIRVKVSFLAKKRHFTSICDQPLKLVSAPWITGPGCFLMSRDLVKWPGDCHITYTVAGMGGSLRPRADALRCRACRVQLPEFSTGLSISIKGFIHIKTWACLLLCCFLDSVFEFYRMG